MSGTAVPWWGHVFPALTLLLVLFPIFNLLEVSFLVWPVILCVDLLAIFLAVATGSLLPVLIVLLLTFLVVGSWMLRIPMTPTGLPSSVAPRWIRHFLSCRHRLGLAEASATLVECRRDGSFIWGRFRAPQLGHTNSGAFRNVLPFLLLIMVTIRLPVTNPSSVFGPGFLLIVLLLGMTKVLLLDVLAAVGLGSISRSSTRGMAGISTQTSGWSLVSGIWLRRALHHLSFSLFIAIRLTDNCVGSVRHGSASAFLSDLRLIRRFTRT